MDEKALLDGKGTHADIYSCSNKTWRGVPGSLPMVYVLMFAKKRKSTYKIFVSAIFPVWTSQGLNLGPPDYESVKIKIFRVS